MKNFVGYAASVLAATTIVAIDSTAEAVPLDLELSLLVDVSGSVSGSEFSLQRGGYSAAFRSGRLQDLITDRTDWGNRRYRRQSDLLVEWIPASRGDRMDADRQCDGRR